MTSSSLETDLRSLVRELIAEVLPEIQRNVEVRNVVITGNGDLSTFIDSIVRLASDPGALARYRSGKLKFEWLESTDPPRDVPGRDGVTSDNAGSRPSAASQDQGGAPKPVLQIDKGAVTERVVAQAAEEGTRIRLGKGAVVTPLARELARRSGVTLERVP